MDITRDGGFFNRPTTPARRAVGCQMGAKLSSGTEHRRVRNQHMGIRLGGIPGGQAGSDIPSDLCHRMGLVSSHPPKALVVKPSRAPSCRQDVARRRERVMRQA